MSVIPRIEATFDAARTRLSDGVRGPRMAVVVGRLLGTAFLLCFATGLYSHFIQDPLPWMVFPNRPVQLYQVTQGVHITAGLLCFPLLLAKLYAVFPQLFATPVVKGPLHLLERASITLFVSTSIVQIVIGMLNTYQWYQLFLFPFRQTHFALSFIVIGSLAIHIAVKLPIIVRYWRARDARVAEQEDAEQDAAASAPRPAPVGGVTGRVMAWIDRAPAPEPRRPARRAFLLGLGGISAALVVLTAGQSTGVLDATNAFAPRKRGTGPNGVPVNRTAKAAGVIETAMASGWALEVVGASATMNLSRVDLGALPQYEVDLPIACVEGWSQMAHWRGPRLKDVMDAVGADPSRTVKLTSLEQKSIYAVTELPPNFARDDLTLLALELDGEQLDIDHGFPVRLIAPARPGVLQTKWLARIEEIA